MADRLFESVAASIEAAIMEGDSPLGTMLPSERDLAASHHVSRNVVRQALARLAQKDLIELIPHRGAVITFCRDDKIAEAIRQMLTAHKATFLHVLEVREVLELAIIDKAVEYIDDDAIDRLFGLWDQMDSLKNDEKVEMFLKHDRILHETIADASANPMFLLLLRTLFSIDSLNVFDLSRTLSSALDDTQNEHLMILNALRDRDPLRARNAVMTHMRNIHSDLSIVTSA